MDLDLRKLRYFAAVAERQHFSRAAEALYIAQPVLSRQIRALEQELGVDLFERTTRTVRLTRAGAQLYEDSSGVLAVAAAATRRAHEAARGVERIIVGFAPGLTVAPAVRAFTAAHPQVAVELLHLNWYEQAETILDGRADVGYLRRPFDVDGLDTVPIGSEPKVACLPNTHPLAAQHRLSLGDLAQEVVLDAGARRTATMEEKLERVASGLGIAILPSSVAQHYARPDLVHVPLSDAVRSETCLAVAQGRRQQHVQDFVTIAAQALVEKDCADRVATVSAVSR